MENHRFYKQAYDAHRGTSHVPEKRATMELERFEIDLKNLKEAGKDDAIPKFESLWLKQINARARCLSAMITGPAQFPTARNEKAMRSYEKRYEEMQYFLKKVFAPPVEPRTELDYGIQEKEYMVGDVKVWHNVEQNRLQLIFDGKPEQAMIDRLKKSGFKWSPRNTAWQRQLTPNAVRVVPYVLQVEGVS